MSKDGAFAGRSEAMAPHTLAVLAMSVLALGVLEGCSTIDRVLGTSGASATSESEDPVATSVPAAPPPGDQVEAGAVQPGDGDMMQDDAEGHSMMPPDGDMMQDDAEGHSMMPDDGDMMHDDAEGHGMMPPDGDMMHDDAAEGHGMMPDDGEVEDAATVVRVTAESGDTLAGILNESGFDSRLWNVVDALGLAGADINTVDVDDEFTFRSSDGDFFYVSWVSARGNFEVELVDGAWVAIAN